MSTFRRIDNLLDGKTSDQLAWEVAARELERADHDRRGHGHTPGPHRSPDLRPLVARTSGSATEGIYGLVLALSVIAVSWYSGSTDAGRVALSVLVTAVVFWVAHVYAYVLGRDMSQEHRLTRAEFVHALREYWSLIEVVVPLLLVLGLGGIDAVSDTAAFVAATVIAAVELAAAGGYAAVRHGASPRMAIASAAGGLTLGVIVVLLKALVYTH
jgi:hypothetical protein